MGFTTNSLQIESVTPDKAREYLSYNYAHNRPLRQGWIKYLANEMREGRFMPTAEIHVMYCNGEPVLVNGQHTCNAIVMHGKPVRATVRKSSTNEHGQIAMMYAFGHDNGIRRSFSDGLGAYNIAQEYDIKPSYVNKLSAALRHIRNGFFDGDTNRNATGMAPSVVEILEHMRDWMPIAKQFIEIASRDNSIKKAALKRGSLSIILVTMRYQPLLARAFWEDVIAPDNVDYYSHAALSRRILESSISRSINLASPLSSAKLSRLLASVWSNYMAGKAMKNKPSRIDESSEIVIAGTPYTGKNGVSPWWPGEER